MKNDDFLMVLWEQSREADAQDARAMLDCEDMRAAGYTPKERLEAWEPR